ncbi:MAG: glycosyl hydrolase [Vicinamibacteria bacterium]|nr:glycosyl hydrolase [Vicinamibacteria bacterium]
MTPRFSRMVPALFGLALAGFASAQDVRVDSDILGGLEARSIGPAVMSGRVSALAAVPGDRLTIYVGAASGGLWKSDDGGVKFKPVFDKYNPSIGDIKVDPSDPKTIWVGTGESWVRNGVSVGDGIYRSTDAGDNWQKLGLEKTERIARIGIDPKDSAKVFACALGPLFGDSDDRGVYVSRDAGKTWEKSLSGAKDAGCADLSVDPKDGQVVYASLWQHRRSPDFFNSGGPKSGLYKSKDGGATWRKLTKGLPEGDLGRIAVEVSPAKSSVVYATVEAKKTGLYRSDDAGETWSLISTAAVVAGRPFYFSRLVADPINPNRIYKTSFGAGTSDDGGKTWSSLSGNFHGDVHAIWVNPKNTDELLLGTDGGAYHSWDRGNRWLFVENLPLSQFYHVAVDMEFPFNVYGGLQDNSSWWGPSRKSGPIGNRDWSALTGGDGFWAFPDPNDEDLVYSEYQGGNVFRTSRKTGEQKDIKPSPVVGDPKYRFNWNTPIHLSPTQKGVMYMGAQFLFRSADRGESWQKISPDLTTNDPAKQRQNDSGGLTRDNSTAENHTTIFAISESPKNPQLIWAGTDDGNLQITRDGGKTWTNVAPNTSVPKGTWVSRVEASSHDEGTAFAAFDGHMTGDMKTYVAKTTDFGKTWTSLATPDTLGYAHVIKQDVVNPNLLFLGTETGLFISIDGGKQWAQFTSGLPMVPVRDLVVHPRGHDLVLATHGRGIFVVDDITPLRALTSEILNSDFAFLPTRAGQLLVGGGGFGGAPWFGDHEFSGLSPEDGASIVYYSKKRHVVGDFKFEVSDATGRLLATIPASKRRGLNRIQWSTREQAPRFAAGAGVIPSLGAFFGARATAGRYTVTAIKNKNTYRSDVTLVGDPRVTYSVSDQALQRETAGRLFGLVERLTWLVESIADLRDQANDRLGKLTARDAALAKRVTAFAAVLEAQRVALVAQQEGEGISGEEKLREELGMLYGNVNGYDGRPTKSQIDRMNALSRDLDAAWAKFTALEKDTASQNVEFGRRKLEALRPMTEEAWRGK